MPYTTTELIAQVRGILNEPAPGFWSDAELEAYLRQGALFTTSTGGGLEVIGELVLVPSTIEYPVPTLWGFPPLGEPVRLVKVYAALLGGKALTRVHPRMFGHLAAFGNDDPVTHWALFGQLLLFSPVGTGISGTVRLLATVVTENPEDVPLEFQHELIDYAVHRAKMKDAKWAEASVAFNLCAARVRFKRTDLIERLPSSKAELVLPDAVVAPAA